MDLRRLRHGEWIAGIAGVVLFVSLFLDWYSVAFKGLPNDPTGASTAWEAFSVADVILAIAALMGIALAIAAATQRAPAVAQALSALTVPVALTAAVFAVVHALSVPDVASAARHGVPRGGWTVYAPISQLHPPVSREIGLWLGLAGVFGVLVGAWRSMGDQSFPATVRPKVDVTPLPAPKPRSEPAAEDE
jgi:hypothetical protein